MTAIPDHETTGTFSPGEDRQVSSPNERLILVDENDRTVGEASKIDCHIGEGKLHRALSLHVITSDGLVLLQRRSAEKLLWPGFWSNSCCSHPRAGEDIAHAVRRRAGEELGLDVEAEFLYKFQYRAAYLDVGHENEVCSVFLAFSDARPRPNPSEIDDCHYVAIDELGGLIESDPELYTPWFRQEWQTLLRDFADRLRPA